jgi:hypothetical protein
MNHSVNLNTCKIINGVKYIQTYYDFKFINTYFDDCVIFMLKDIHANAHCLNIRNRAEKYFNGELVKVPAILYDISFVEDLYFNFIENITEANFIFDELEDGEELEVDMDNFMTFEKWLNKLNELKRLLFIRHKKLRLWEEELMNCDEYKIKQSSNL